MPKSDNIEVEGVVVEALPNANFRVELAGGHKATRYKAGSAAALRYLPAVGYGKP